MPLTVADTQLNCPFVSNLSEFDTFGSVVKPAHCGIWSWPGTILARDDSGPGRFWAGAILEFATPLW